jgi:hypothetical protein
MAVADENAGHFFCIAHLGAPGTMGFLKCRASAVEGHHARSPLA